MKTLKALLAVSCLVIATSAGAQSYTEPTNTNNCMQAVSDTRQAKEENPALGEKSQAVFDQIVELAVKRCQDKEFQHAGELLNIARGMVASE